MRFFRRRSDETTGASTTTMDEAAMLAEVERLEGTGNLADALDLLAALNRAHPDPERTVRIRDMRIAAAEALGLGSARADWPPAYDDPFPDVVGEIPEVRAGGLSTETLGGAVTHHGALIVRGALASDQVQRLAEAIETTHQRKVSGDLSADLADQRDSWYQPVAGGDSLREWVASTGGTWLGDSPTSTEIVLAELEQAGIVSAITGHLGERPVISLQKSTLRRTLPEYGIIAWHQDGSFLGPEVRTMNVWVALSACGGTAPSPGLEIVPIRQESILPVDGVLSPVAVSEELVAEQARDHPTVVPAFAPGDAILFDERLLHRTFLREGMTEIRYALECWFFAPSVVTSSYTPLLV